VLSSIILLTRGDALRSAQRLPLAVILRARGAARNKSDFGGKIQFILFLELAAWIDWLRASTHLPLKGFTPGELSNLR
jgi:hypothetical protein